MDKKQSQAEKRNLQEAWLKEYEGLFYDKDKDFLVLIICQKHSVSTNGQSIFVKGTNKKQLISFLIIDKNVNAKKQ